MSSITWACNSGCSFVWLDQNERRTDVASPVFDVCHLPFIPSYLNLSLSSFKGDVMVKEMLGVGEFPISS